MHAAVIAYVANSGSTGSGNAYCSTSNDGRRRICCNHSRSGHGSKLNPGNKPTGTHTSAIAHRNTRAHADTADCRAALTRWRGH